MFYVGFFDEIIDHLFLKELITSARSSFGLTLGVLAAFRVEKNDECRVVLLSNGWTPPKTNVPPPPLRFRSFSPSSTLSPCPFSSRFAVASSVSSSRVDTQLSCPITAALKHATTGTNELFYCSIIGSGGSPSLFSTRSRKRWCLADSTKSRRLFL